MLNFLICGQEISRGSDISLGTFIFLLSENIFLFIFMSYFLMDRPDNKNFWRSLFDRNRLANGYFNFMKFSKVERGSFMLNIIYCLLSILLLVLYLPNSGWVDSDLRWSINANISWIFKAQLFMVSATCLMGYAYKHFINGERHQ